MAAPTLDDPVIERLATAYHEAGHAIAHSLAGGKVDFVRILRNGQGQTRRKDLPPSKLREFLVMMLAGIEAEVVFLVSRGYTPRAARTIALSSAAGDLDMFAETAAGSPYTVADLQPSAEKLVRRKQNWKRISRLAEKLNEKGRVSGFWI